MGIGPSGDTGVVVENLNGADLREWVRQPSQVASIPNTRTVVRHTLRAAPTHISRLAVESCSRRGPSDGSADTLSAFHHQIRSAV